jgi:hypothetical protein
LRLFFTDLYGQFAANGTFRTIINFIAIKQMAHKLLLFGNKSEGLKYVFITQIAVMHHCNIGHYLVDSLYDYEPSYPASFVIES